MKISALIVDDEFLARRRIHNLLKGFSEIEVIGNCKTGLDAIDKIESLNPDLVFLDINLKNMTGFEVLERINNEVPPVVIFITAYDEFALKAFEFFAFDYLLKPYSEERFQESTIRAIKLIKKGDLSLSEKKLRSLLSQIKIQEKPAQSGKETFPIKLGNKVTFIKALDVKYITASGYYAEIHTTAKKYLLRESLKNLINDLGPMVFIRVHRSTILNTEFIEELLTSSYGEVDVKMKDGKVFRVSKSYKKEFLQKMGI